MNHFFGDDEASRYVPAKVLYMVENEYRQYGIANYYLKTRIEEIIGEMGVQVKDLSNGYSVVICNNTNME